MNSTVDENKYREILLRSAKQSGGGVMQVRYIGERAKREFIWDGAFIDWRPIQEYNVVLNWWYAMALSGPGSMIVSYLNYWLVGGYDAEKTFAFCGMLTMIIWAPAMLVVVPGIIMTKIDRRKWVNKFIDKYKFNPLKDKPPFPKAYTKY